MAVEIQDIIARIASDCVAWAESALSTLSALDSASMPNGLNPGDLVVGTAVGGGVGGSAVNGGGGGDGNRGFRYTGEDGTIRDSPSDGGTVVGDAPSGGRLVYDSVVRDSNGTPTHYHVTVPGGPSGFIPAGNTSNTRPTVAPPSKPSVVIDGGAGLANVSGTQVAAARG